MKNIDLETVRALDENGIQRFIASCEADFEKQFLKPAEYLLKNDIRLIFLAGPSSSGKTTSAAKLISFFKKFGKNVISISTDDYFFDANKAPVDKNGIANYELFELIDSDLLIRDVSELLAGKEVALPYFDFKTRKRQGNKPPVHPDGTEIVIVEGIHALNDKFMKCELFPEVIGIYIRPQEPLFLNEVAFLSSDDIRFLRRLVRDNTHRGATPQDTFRIWQNVLDGEELFINPFLKNASYTISSTYCYEPFVIRNKALELLSEIPPESIFRIKAQSLIQRLERIFSIDEKYVPDDSLLTEFLR